MHEYQVLTYQFAYDHPRCAIWLPMGLGKTVAVGTVIADLIASFQSQRVLIIAPKAVAEFTWPEEFAKWEHLHGLTYHNMTGEPKDIRLQIAQQTNADIHIINVENFLWLTRLYKLGEFPWDTIILDESSLYKNYSAKRTKAMLRRMPEIRRVIQMTGTPASKGLKNVFTQIRMLDDPQNPGEFRLGRTFKSFSEKYFDKTGYMGKELKLKPDAEELIYDAIAPVVLRLDAKDYLDVEEPIETPIYVDLVGKEKTDYRKLEREYLLEVEDAEDIVAFNSSALRQKIRQYVQGHVYTEDDEVLEIHERKFQALERLRDEMPGQNMVIVYHFQSDLARLKQKYPEAKDLREPNAKAEWDSGELSILLLHPASGGHGLNLQYGGHIMVWFTLTDDTELVQQTNARLPRPGQTNVVMIYYLIGRDTVDEEIYATNRGDISTEKEMLDAMKARRDARN